VRKGRDRPFFLVRWIGGRDQIDALQPEIVPDLFGQPEVPQVDGIKGAAKYPDSQSLLPSSANKRKVLRQDNRIYRM
jgi:hypothetical protein